MRPCRHEIEIELFHMAFVTWVIPQVLCRFLSGVLSSPLRCSLIPSQVFSIFEDLEISVDVVATSEVSISLTLDPAKLWSRNLIQQVR